MADSDTPEKPEDSPAVPTPSPTPEKRKEESEPAIEPEATDRSSETAAPTDKATEEPVVEPSETKPAPRDTEETTAADDQPKLGTPAFEDEETEPASEAKPVPRSNSSGHGVPPRKQEPAAGEEDPSPETQDPGHENEWRDEDHDEWHDHDEHYHDDPYHYEYDEDGHYYGNDPYHGEVKPSHDAVATSHTGRETDLAVREQASSSSGGGGGDSSDSDDDEDDEYGGPIKSFLEHLEDLRWVLVKCAAVMVVTCTLCLVAADKVVGLLMLPMDLAHAKAKQMAFKELERSGHLPPPMIQLKLGGTNTMSFEVDETLGAQFGSLSVLKRGDMLPMRLAPTLDASTNIVLALKPDGEIVKFEPQVAIPTLQPLGVLDPFFAALKIALYGGIALGLPFILFFIGQFVVPALHQHERAFLGKGVAMGGILFFAGVIFAYLFISKMTVLASVSFAQWMGFSSNIWRVDAYIGFVCKLMLGVGLGFELPVILLTLVKIGIVDHHGLVKFRPYWVIVNLVTCAFLTPPDVVSQVMMAIPMQLLYEVSILIARFWARKEERAAAKDLATRA